MSNLTTEQVERVQELIQRSDLTGIQFHEASAKVDEHAGKGTESEEAKIDLGYQTRSTDDDFGIRASVDVKAPSGTARVVVAADYSLSEQGAPDPETLELFATEVALMTLIPYLREGIHSLTGRVFGVPLVLPMVQRGEIGSSDVVEEAAR